ncbi:nck-associated protein 5-like [Pseudophryne corroboree]|uniref:nck-associated protein 5-like n=1 Tax=Pseudophryne corroboree TaxID=495146 RepID=UPI0030820E70
MTSEVEEEIRLLSGGVSEPLVIQELLERLRELEAENSTLAQANETQRETYERCLDEVANHVVQALLNQKDLREECIKLKKRVFDLERQNRALNDLFHQRLQRSSGSSPELHPLQALSDPQGGDLERVSVSLPLGQCAVQREEKHRSGRAQTSCRPLDAMSPFLRKKAQILEVLRRLEATGSQSGSTCTAPPMFLGGFPSTSGNGLRVRPEQNLDYVNGEGLTPPEHGGDEPWASCLLLAQNGWEELLKWKPIQREPPAGSPGEGGGEHLGFGAGEDTQQTARQAEGSSSSSDEDIGEPPPPPSEIRQHLPLTDLTKGLAPCMCSRGAGDKRGPVEGHSDGTGFNRGHIGHLHSLTCYSRNLHNMVEIQNISVTTPAVTERADSVSCSPGKQLVLESGSDAPASPCPPSPDGPASLPRDTSGLTPKSVAHELQDDYSHSSLVVSNLSCPDPHDALIPLSEPRTPQIPSPAKFLKFLKMPSSGDKLQSPNSLRLSPQLTQTSKIPCRSNNYEVFPSPRLGRKAAEELPGPEADTAPPSPSDLIHSDTNRQGQSERSNNLIIRPGVPCCTKKSHDYENIPAKNSELPTSSQTVDDLEDSPKQVGAVCSSSCSPAIYVHSQINCSADHHSQMSTPFIRKHVTSRKPPESTGHIPFKERIGKLRGTDNQQTEITAAGTENIRVTTDGPDLRPSMKRSLGVSSLRTPEPGSTESYPPRYHGQKSDSARTRQPTSNCPPGSPHGPRNPPRAPTVPSKSPRSPHSSPTKLPAKSPSKATAKPLVSRPLSEELRPSPRQPILSEDKQRLQSAGTGKKNGTCQEYACPRSAGPPGTESLPLSVLHSAIEEKVMKGIKENMLRLQEQHRTPAPDPKQRNSSGIASWFGLKKSKLPALSRRPETGRVKEEKRERAASGSPRTRDGKGESLNISMLMEKAEDLRKALQEERAYINGLAHDKNRTAVSVDQTQTTRPLTADNFMQQLLNRVDGKDPPLEGRLEGKAPPLRDFPRLSPENKEARPFRPPRNGIVTHVQRFEQKSMDQNREVVLPSDERISESIATQHFAACDSLTRTLDSGIGTFPPPDYCGGTPNKSTPKLKPKLDSPSVLPVGRFSAFPKVPRRARTLERDMRGVEEMLQSGQHQSVPAFHALLEPEPTIGHRVYREDSNRDRNLPQQGKNWTFPNAKVSTGSAENFRSRAHELVEIPSEGDRDCDMSGYPHPSLCFPGSVSSRTPSTSEVGDEGTSEAKSRENEQGQTGLENSESLSDSLYDSLSSCGSQG